MTFLLCPECCQWREPADGRCPVCAAALDLAIPDPSLDSIADEIGQLHERVGEADLVRTVLPRRGCLFSTSNGLFFVPSESTVIVFDEARRAAANQGAASRLISLLWSKLTARDRVARLACEKRTGELVTRDPVGLAELLRSDPGVWFLARGSIASWQRQRGQWAFVRPNGFSWPERIAMRERDGDRALQTWLEKTECPLPVNAR
jgi:hypothetical protein